MTLLTAPEALKASSTLRVFATATRPAVAPICHGEVETEQLDLVIVNDGRPCRPKIAALIAAALGEGWSLGEWWMPEPTDEF